MTEGRRARRRRRLREAAFLAAYVSFVVTVLLYLADAAMLLG